MSDTNAQYRQYRFSPAPEAATILLVRHGESAPAEPDKPFALVDGHGDPALHPQGHLQAAKIAERFTRPGAEPIDAIYVTTLQRTHQTAAPLAAELGLVPVVESELREVFLGEWEGGKIRMKAAEGDPLFQKIFEHERWDVIPGAEPADAFEARVVDAVRRIANAHPGGRVVAVVHGGVIGQILASATRSRGFAFEGADNGSVSEIVVHGPRIIVRGFNDTSHLQ